MRNTVILCGIISSLWGWTNSEADVYSHYADKSNTTAIAENTGTAKKFTSKSPDAAKTWKILPIGDSLTQGSWYRSILKKSLEKSRIKSDFIGPISNCIGDTTDCDHAGFSGFTI